MKKQDSASINSKKIRIAFLGTPEFAATILECLAKRAGFEVTTVITQEDKLAGRKKRLTPPPVKIAAENAGLRVLQPKNSKELEKILENIEVDFFVVVGLGMILTEKSLESAKIAPINIHASLLPKYRGASPIQEALLQGDKETGICIMQMTQKLDAGPVFFTKRVQIEPSDNFESFSERLADESCKILPHVLMDIKEGNLRAMPQKKEGQSYCHKIEKNDGKIDWGKKSAMQILNMIRAYSLWPGVFTEIGGKKIRILEAKIEEDQMAPGEMKIENKILKIGTKKGSLMPTKVQPEGKNAMNVQDYINGYLKDFLQT